jgi:ABC-2 type transport system permease protein
MIATAARPVSPVRAFTILLRWRITQLRKELPQILLVQVLVATGTGVGLGFLISDADPIAGSYLATGAFLLNLFIIAIVMVPQTVAEAKLSGARDYMSSLPVPRLAESLAEVVVWAVAILPGMLISLVITSIRFDVDLRLSVLIVPAILLTLVTATAVGTAIGHKSVSQQMTGLVTNALLMLVLLFSPVNFPLDRLPGWLQGVHTVLPIAAMADLLRGALLAGYESDVARDLLMLGIWATVAWTITWRSITKAG